MLFLEFRNVVFKANTHHKGFKPCNPPQILASKMNAIDARLHEQASLPRRLLPPTPCLSLCLCLSVSLCLSLNLFLFLSLPPLPSLPMPLSLSLSFSLPLLHLSLLFSVCHSLSPFYLSIDRSIHLSLSLSLLTLSWLQGFASQ